MPATKDLSDSPKDWLSALAESADKFCAYSEFLLTQKQGYALSDNASDSIVAKLSRYV